MLGHSYICLGIIKKNYNRVMRVAYVRILLYAYYIK